MIDLYNALIQKLRYTFIKTNYCQIIFGCKIPSNEKDNYIH